MAMIKLIFVCAVLVSLCSAVPYYPYYGGLVPCDLDEKADPSLNEDSTHESEETIDKVEYGGAAHTHGYSGGSYHDQAHGPHHAAGVNGGYLGGGGFAGSSAIGHRPSGFHGGLHASGVLGGVPHGGYNHGGGVGVSAIHNSGPVLFTPGIHDRPVNNHHTFGAHGSLGLHGGPFNHIGGGFGGGFNTAGSLWPFSSLHGSNYYAGAHIPQNVHGEQFHHGEYIGPEVHQPYRPVHHIHRSPLVVPSRIPGISDMHAGVPLVYENVPSSRGSPVLIRMPNGQVLIRGDPFANIAYPPSPTQHIQAQTYGISMGNAPVQPSAQLQAAAASHAAPNGAPSNFKYEVVPSPVQETQQPAGTASSGSKTHDSDEKVPAASGDNLKDEVALLHQEENSTDVPVHVGRSENDI